MSFRVVTGLPHNGKGIVLADRFFFLAERNKAWAKKTGIVRKIGSNIKYAPHITEKYRDFLDPWDDIDELPTRQGQDILIDEMGIHFDATRWADLSLDVKAWLYLHEHYGIELYGATQDFGQIDIAVRRITSSLVYCRKLMGSRRPHPTKPPVGFVWGLIAINTIPRKEYTKPANEYSEPSMALLKAELLPIRKKYTSMYDTLQVIKESKPANLKHIERECLKCGKIHITHR